MSTCLVTGGAGNLACELSRTLSSQFERIVLFDIAPAPVALIASNAIFERGNLLNPSRVEELFLQHRPTQVIHLASLLSGSCEQDRPQAWRVNLDGSFSLFETVLRHGRPTVLFPSSVAAFGGPSPEELNDNTPQWPDGLYGVTKMAVERLGVYYHRKHGLDFRSVRLPITVSRQAPAGAASALAARAFIEAVSLGTFTFRAHPDTRLALVYLPDVMQGLKRLLTAPSEQLTKRVYNISAITVTPRDIADAIKRRLPKVDLRFEVEPGIAHLLAGWPGRIDDHAARRDWGWQPHFDLDRMADDFISALQAEFNPNHPRLISMNPRA